MRNLFKEYRLILAGQRALEARYCLPHQPVRWLFVIKYFLNPKSWLK